MIITRNKAATPRVLILHRGAELGAHRGRWSCGCSAEQKDDRAPRRKREVSPLPACDNQSINVTAAVTGQTLFRGNFLQRGRGQHDPRRPLPPLSPQLGLTCWLSWRGDFSRILISNQLVNQPPAFVCDERACVCLGGEGFWALINGSFDADSCELGLSSCWKRVRRRAVGRSPAVGTGMEAMQSQRRRRIIVWPDCACWRRRHRHCVHVLAFD
jgi:hypothetical protein